MSATYTFDVFSSLDGYGAASGDWTGYWGKQGPELLDHRLAQYGAEHRMVFGANTYRLFAQMLASSTEESDVRDPWVTRMWRLPATVVSTTLEGPLDWPDATVVSGDAVDVAALKQESDVPMRSHGSLRRRVVRWCGADAVPNSTAPMSLWTTYLLQPLAAHFRVTIFDNRGGGYSSDDTSVPLSVPLMARDTAALITQLGVRTPTVAGWSMGGEIAITMAALHLGSIGRIVSSGGDAGSTNTIHPPPGSEPIVGLGVCALGPYSG